MTAMTNTSVIRQPRPSSLADVLDLILDKGLVIDAYVRVSLVGIELLTIDARIVIASVDTYLRFASATNRLDLRQSDDSEGLPQLMHDMVSGGASDKSSGALEGAKKQLTSWFGGDDDEEDGGDGNGDGSERKQRPPQKRTSAAERRPRAKKATSARNGRDGQRRRRSRDEDDS
jgi:gas vesicle structural protein